MQAPRVRNKAATATTRMHTHFADPLLGARLLSEELVDASGVDSGFGGKTGGLGGGVGRDGFGLGIAGNEPLGVGEILTV